MAAKILTMQVQVGTDGFEIAGQVAARLGYRYWDREVTLAAGPAPLLRPRFGEVTPAANMASSLAIAQVLGEDVPPAMLTAEAEVLSDAVIELAVSGYWTQIERAVRDIAREGNAVIVGHAAQALLRGRTDVLRVLITGSSRCRAERLSRQQENRVRLGEAAVVATDLAQAMFFTRTFALDWLDTALYDLVINTDQTDPVSAIEIIEAAAGVPDRPDGGGHRTQPAADAKPDSLLGYARRARLVRPGARVAA